MWTNNYIVSCSCYQLSHATAMQAQSSDIHPVVRQEPTGGAVFIPYSTQSSSLPISHQHLLTFLKIYHRIPW